MTRPALTRWATRCGPAPGRLRPPSRWLVALGALWIWSGMFVLSYQVGSLIAVATFVGVAFMFGGITQPW